MKSLSFAIAVFFLGISTALADMDPRLEARGWQEIIFDELPPNSYSLPDGETIDGEAIAVVSDNSVSVAYLNLDIDIAATPYMEWQWRSESPGPDTDTTKKGGDDRTLSVYVAFPYQPDEAGFKEKLQRPGIELLKGKDTPGRVISYIWGGGAPEGTGFANPYTGNYGRMIIKATPDAPLGQWHSVKINLRDDFMEAFGYAPANPVYVAVSTDSDDTMSEIRAAVRGLRFVAE